MIRQAGQAGANNEYRKASEIIAYHYIEEEKIFFVIEHNV